MWVRPGSDPPPLAGDVVERGGADLRVDVARHGEADFDGRAQRQRRRTDRHPRRAVGRLRRGDLVAGVTLLRGPPSRTHVGATPPGPVIPAAVAPAPVRYWNAVPFAADTSMKANGALEASDPRIITPAFDQLLIACTEATRAIICPSPVSD